MVILKLLEDFGRINRRCFIIFQIYTAVGAHGAVPIVTSFIIERHSRLGTSHRNDSGE